MPSAPQSSASWQHDDSVHVVQSPAGNLYPHFGTPRHASDVEQSEAHVRVQEQPAAAVSGPSAFGNFVRHVFWHDAEPLHACAQS